jgi:hypothetical protein
MSEIPLGTFPPAKCAPPGAKPDEKCPKLWEKWCRGCNLVFCTEHSAPEAHNCRSLRPPTPAIPDAPAPPPPPAPEPPKKERRKK